MLKKVENLFAMCVIYAMGLVALWIMLFKMILPVIPGAATWGIYICAPFVVAILWGYLVLHLFETYVFKKDGDV